MAEPFEEELMLAWRKDRPDTTVLERLEALCRAHYRLEDEDLVLAGEDAGRLPGEPLRVTTLLFWKASERHRVRVFKPATEVSADDLPAPYLAGALRDEGEIDCC